VLSPKSRNILTLLTILFLVSAFILPGYASPLEQKIRQTQQELSSIQKRLEDRGKQLAESQNEEKRLEGDLMKLERSLSLLRRDLNELEKTIKETEQNIEITEQQLADAEEQVELRDNLLRKRLRAIYEKGETGYLDVLFDAYSFAEFLTRLNDLKLIAENDLKLLEESFAERAAIQEKKDKLEEEKERLLNLKVERLNRREELNKQQAEREALLDTVQKNIEAQEKAVRELEQEAQKIETIIKQLQEEMRRQTERFTPSGKLLWPLAEYGTSWITSGYGPRVHPITKRPGEFHGGIDIGIPRTRWPGSSSYNGNPVYIRAADNGIVIYAGISGSLTYGYGRVVIVDHGKGLATVYAHCHTILVAPGQEVARGQHIAIVGSTGSSTGPHLHFEVRINGERQSPMGYF
jgi:murein DD-endopeptidase MepM/ murein hydrolase activator NlpD